MPELESDCAALHLDNRTTIFDTSDPLRMPAFNPFRRSFLPIETQTLWLLEALRSCFGQRSFDETPQRPRWLFNAIAPVLETSESLFDVLNLLNFHSVGHRQELVSGSSNALVRTEWEAYDELSPTRRRDETYSAYGWLYRICQEPVIQKLMFSGQPSLELDTLIREPNILLSSFPRYRPLSLEATYFIRSMLLQLFVSYCFAIPLGERPPVYLILDEAEHALERDTGVLETILNEGRSLGIHLILICHNFEQVARNNPALLASTLTNCRTKIVGGELYEPDQTLLSSVFFTAEWHPHMVRNMLYSPFLEPNETTRTQHSKSTGTHEDTSESQSLTDTLGASKAKTEQESRSNADARSTAYAVAVSKARAEGFGTSANVGAVMGAGTGVVYGADGVTELSTSEMGTNTQIDAAGISSMTTDISGVSKIRAQGLAAITAITKGIANSLTESTSRAMGKTDGKTSGWNEATGETVVPFYEYVKHWIVSNVEFLSLQDYLVTRGNLIRKRKQGEWLIHTPTGKNILFKATRITSLLKGSERLKSFHATVLRAPWYPKNVTPEMDSLVELPPPPDDPISDLPTPAEGDESLLPMADDDF